MRPQDSRGSHLTALPPDLLIQSARRLHTIALLYAFVFFISNPFTALVFPEERVRFLSSVARWAPSTVSIVTALLVAGLTRSRHIRPGTLLVLGLVFQVFGSFGIAAAQYWDVARYATEPPWAGLSWVAVWMLGFTVMIPSPPRWALAAAIGSASAVPLVSSAALAGRGSAVALPFFFFQVVLPYVLVVVVSYVGARTVYRLGAELKRARELGSYRLIERLGAGGMGEVWKAEHRLLARPAAVKLIRPEVLGGSTPERRSEVHARFEREAQAIASLRSPHTIALYDFGVADDGAFYYAMELLDGFDVQTLVDRFGPVPPERAIHLLTQVCHSLAEAHTAGLIHRDIKPANVYVCRNGRDVDFVKVLDFGLVKPVGTASAIALTVTTDHLVAGTPAFMPPEQVLNNSPLDARADIYAVGCLAYWLLTGQVVFSGRTILDTLMQHAQAAPIPPSQRTELAIPEELERVVLACLEKDPQNRPATADDLWARLHAVQTAAAWPGDRASLWWDVHHPR